MVKTRALWTSMCLLALGLLAGCDDMDQQPKYKPLEPAPFFADERSARTPPAGTIARGHLKDDALLFTGKENGQLSNRFPYPITAEILKRGRERYDIFCAVCHGRTGDGQGMIVKRGFPTPPSFHDERLRKAPVGHTFDVITNGFGVMYSYNDRIPVKDRWAIAAYIRALQRSQQGTIKDVPVKERAALGETP